MKLKSRFVISLFAILLLCWADVFFVGTHKNASFPGIWRQPLHVITLITTMAIGYFNWKDYPEKWLAGLWVSAYAMMVIILAISGTLYFLKVPHSLDFSRLAIYLRNRFTSPLLFLIWYMLHLMSKYMTLGKRSLR